MGVYKYYGYMYNQGIAGRARNDEGVGIAGRARNDEGGWGLRVEPAMTPDMAIARSNFPLTLFILKP